ncbi:unnamed protein product [Ostreobium quekettii]|uniref:Uncharacterized protein n=1 Tax=Ostreobium quekettii TaxID=121088 RepID=A0A8S1JG38_9CHLO|nr:unnamed protein product [Ostreobium quekettii]|eukprot:evm.model.scf_75.11 EVM.evm.TU.scf_75.11   scf_75:78127-81456(+)
MARPLAALAAAVLLALAGLAAGRITHRAIAHDPRPLIIVEMPFGFGAGGRVEVQVRDAAVHVSLGNLGGLGPELLGRLGLFIAPAREDTVMAEQYGDECPLDRMDSRVLVLFNHTGIQEQVNSSRGTPEAGASGDLVVSAGVTPSLPGQYALYYANCNKLGLLQVSFTARIEEYNQVAGGRKDYLSVGETELPSLYTGMFLVFSLMAAAWAYLCWKERHNVHNIHYLMMVLIVFRALTYLAEAGMQHYIRATGDPSGWNIAYYIFTFFRGIMFFTVLVLIGTGWSYVKPFVGEKEKKILVVVIPLQVFANIAIIVLDEASPVRESWFEWKDMFRLVDIVCCCAILFPIVWSIKHLREGAESDGKAAVNMEKLTLFRQFYVLVVVYIYFTRIIVYLLQTTLSFEQSWMSNAAEELATLTFYLLVGIKFRPHSENRYFRLASDAAV